MRPPISLSEFSPEAIAKLDKLYRNDRRWANVNVNSDCVVGR